MAEARFEDCKQGNAMGTRWHGMIFCLAAIAFVTGVLPDRSYSQSLPMIVEAAWSRATPPTAKVGAVYLTVKNTGSVNDRLIGGGTPLAVRVEFHEMGIQNGVNFMKKIDGLDIPALGKIAFEPGGLHLMLIGLIGRLEEGQTYPLELHFEKAGIVKEEVVVKGFAARAHKAGSCPKTHAGHAQCEDGASHVQSQ
jgi:copper(I)-binding protein